MKELRIIAESIHQVTGMDIRSKSRRREIVDAKALFYHFAEELLDKNATLFHLFTGQDRTTAIHYFNSNHVEYNDFTWKDKIQEIEDLIFDKLRENGRLKASIKVNGKTKTFSFCSRRDFELQSWSIYNELINEEIND